MEVADLPKEKLVKVFPLNNQAWNYRIGILSYKMFYCRFILTYHLRDPQADP